MSSQKKYHCVCEICSTHFRSKSKFKTLCPEHNKKLVNLEVDEDVDELPTADDETDSLDLPDDFLMN